MLLGPGTGFIGTLMGETPVSTIKYHCDRALMAEGAFQQHPVPPWHLVIFGVGFTRLWFFRNRVGGCSLPNKEADGKRISRNRLLTTNALCPCHCVCESLCLLERKHPERESTPCGYRSEEHMSELQSPCNLVCRLL